MRLPLVLSLGLLTVSWPTQAGPGPFLPQNDAGTGQDAPNTQALVTDAFRLQLGVLYSGEVFTAGSQDQVPSPLGDPEDWYKMDLVGGQRAVFRIRIPTDPTFNVAGLQMDTADLTRQTVAELRNAAGALLDWTISYGPSTNPSTGMWPIEQTGTYFLRIVPTWARAQYQIEVFQQSGPGPAVTHEGNGFLAYGFRVLPGGRITVESRVTAAYQEDDGRTIIWWLLRRDANGSWVDAQGGGSYFYAGMGIDRAHVQLGPTEIGADPAAVKSHLPSRHQRFWTLNEPGDYYVVAASSSGVSSQQFFVSSQEGPLELGPADLPTVRAGTEGLRILRAHHFRGDVAANAGAGEVQVRASNNTKADVEVQHHALAWWNCNRLLRVNLPLGPVNGPRPPVSLCHYVDAEGNVFAQDKEFVEIIRRVAPGTWAFHRDLEVALDIAVPLLFMADVPLP